MCSERSQTNPYATEVIRNKKRELIDGISNTDVLLDLLISSGVLLPQSRQLMSHITGREERTSRMLNILVSRGERACRIFFYPCLKKAEPDLYQSMRTYVAGVNESIRDARRQLIGYLIEKDGHVPGTGGMKEGPLNRHPMWEADSQQRSNKKCKDENSTALESPQKRHSDPDDIPGDIANASALGDLSLLEKDLAARGVNDLISGNDNLLYMAADSGKVSTIELLLGRGAKLDFRDQAGRTALHRAAEKGHVDATVAIIKAGADIHAKDHDSKTPVHLAAKNRHTGTIRALVQEEARTCKNKTTFLHMTAVEGDSELTESLLQSGATVDAKDRQRKTPLFHAVSCGNERAAAALLRAGAQLDGVTINAAFELNRKSMLSLLLHHVKTKMSPQDMMSALFRAVHRDLDGIVAALIDMGADANAQNEAGYTPLLLAAELGNVEVFKMLVAKQASLDDRLPNLTSALHLAIHSASAPITKILLEKGLDPNTPGPKDQTPLHLCAIHNQPALMRQLLRAGGQVNAVTQDGYTALHIASQLGHTEVVTKLVESKANIHTKDKQGRTALHWAAAKGEAGVVRLLLSAGGDANVTEKEKKSPLHLAAMEGQSGAVSALLLGRAKAAAKDMDGCSPLHYAAANGHDRAAAILLSSGKHTSVNEKNAWRKTPLHVASEHGQELVVDLLLSNGAKINALDSNKDSPLHSASRSGHKGTVQILVNWTQGERANLQAINNVKKTALQVAEAGESQSHQSIAILLRKKMFLSK